MVSLVGAASQGAHKRKRMVVVRVVPVGRPQLGGRVLVGGGGCCSGGHVQEWVVMTMVRERCFRWVIVLVVGLLHSVVNCHCPARTVPVFAAPPIGDVFVVIAAHFVVSVAVEYERSSAPLSWNEGYGGHA